MKYIINSILNKFGVRMIRTLTYNKLVSNIDKFRCFEPFDLIDKEYIEIFIEHFPKSKSQLKQDLFVLSELGFKTKGFFVEFGATDGIELSNTHLLETEFEWKGILAEPARIWHSQLEINRSASIETACVWRESNEVLVFNEVDNEGLNRGLSTIDKYSDKDLHRDLRETGKNKYEVNTISLGDMLRKHNAPKKIDYLSIDTEGSEYEILKNFNFDEYDIKIITCEHNFTPMRNKIYNLLTSNGYRRKYIEHSRFDDWYVRQ